MSRFYKSAPRADTIDFMYQPPLAMMLKAQEFNDQQIDQRYKEEAILQDQLLKAKYLTADEKKAKAALGKWQTGLDQAAGMMDENVMNWRKTLPILNDMSQKLNQDMMTGELAAFAQQVDKRMALQKAAEEGKKLFMEGKGGQSPDMINAYMNSLDQQYQDQGGLQYDKETGTTLKGYPTVEMATYQDPQKILEIIKNNVENSYEKKQVIRNGQTVIEYVDKNGGEVSPERIMSEAYALLKSNPAYMYYLKHGHQFGYLPGLYKDIEDPVTGEKKTVETAPYEYVDDLNNPVIDPKTKKQKVDGSGKPVYEKKVQWNWSNPMANPIAAVTQIYAHSKPSNTEEFKAFDPAYTTALDLNKQMKLKEFEKKLAEGPKPAIIFGEESTPLFKEGELSSKNIDGLIATYEKTPVEERTPQMLTNYLKAKETKGIIKSIVEKQLKNVASPEDIAFLQQYIPDLVSGNKTNSELWYKLPTDQLRVSIDPYQLTAVGEKAMKLWKKYSSAQEAIIKGVEENNKVRKPVVPYQDNDFGKVQKYIAETAASFKDFNMTDGNGNPLELKIDADTGWGFGEKDVTSPKDLLPYMNLMYTVENSDGTYSTVYKIDPSKLPEQFAIQEKGGVSKNYYGTVKFTYTNNTLKQAERAALKDLGRDTPEVQGYLNITGDDLLSYLDANINNVNYVDADGSLVTVDNQVSYVDLSQFMPNSYMQVSMGDPNTPMSAVFNFNGIEIPVTALEKQEDKGTGQLRRPTKADFILKASELIKSSYQEYLKGLENNVGK